MAAIIADVTETSISVGADDHVVNMPATVNSGELLVILGSAYGVTVTAMTSGGFTKNQEQFHNSGVLSIYSKIADGSEAGTTVTIDPGAGSGDIVTGSYQVLRIQDWYGSGGFELATPSTGQNSSAPIPSVTASWGAEDNLFIEVVSMNDDDATVTAASTGYGNLQNTGSGGGTNNSASIAHATRTASVATDSPDNVTISENENYITSLLVVRPAAVSDSTDPTPGNSGAFGAETNVTQNSFDVNYTKATDDTSAQSALRYYLYTSTQNNIGSVANAEANGTLQNAGGTLDVATLSATGLNPGTRYYYTVVVEDEAGNKAAYNVTNAVTSYLYGNVDLSGVNTQNAVIWCHDLGTDHVLTTPVLAGSVQSDAQGDFLVNTVTYDPTHSYLLSVGYWEVIASGTATGGTTQSIEDTGAFVAGAYDDGQYHARLNSGEVVRITSNTADGVNVEAPFDVAAANGDSYEILKWKSDETIFIARRE